MTAAALSTATGYTKRIIAEECDVLERAGSLSVRKEGNRFYYSLARPRALRTLVGELPPISPDWAALLPMVSVLTRLDDTKDDIPQRVLVTEARRAFREIEDDLKTLNLAGPADRKGAELIPAMTDWSSRIMSAIGRGEWPDGLIGDPVGEFAGGEKHE